MKPTTTADNKILVNEIGFDFDGVIANTGETFVNIACNTYNYCSFTVEDITNFELQDCIDMPESVVETIFTEILIDSVGTGLKPMVGAVEVIEKLTQLDTVTIITARPLKQPLMEWLDLHFRDTVIDKLKIIATGDHNDKARHIHDNNLKFFIDDRAATCHQLAEADITPIVFSQPWNENRHDFQSVGGWHEILELIDTTELAERN